MTFKEKLAMEHPERVDILYAGGCSNCPYFYGYETHDESVKNCIRNKGKGCDYCWNREIPESESAVVENLSTKIEKTFDLKEKYNLKPL